MLYPNIKLEVRDFQIKPFSKKFDWIFMSGVMSFVRNYNFIEKLIEDSFKICKKGISINFISDLADFKSKDLFYADPTKIFTIAKKFSKRILIRHDYAPYQFVLYVYKKNLKSNNNVFRSYLEDNADKINDKDWNPFLKNRKS